MKISEEAGVYLAAHIKASNVGGGGTYNSLDEA